MPLQNLKHSLAMRKVNKDALQKMYLLTEPAFKTVKEHLENDKHLSELDKDMKSILYDRKSPNRTKLLRYLQALTRYTGFKRHLNENKINNEKTQENEVEKLMKSVEHSQIPKKFQSKEIQTDKELKTPKKVQSREIQTDKEKSKSNIIDDSLNEMNTSIVPLQNEEIIETSNNLNESEVIDQNKDDSIIQQQIDDHILAKSTIREKLDKNPAVSRIFLLQNGDYLNRTPIIQLEPESSDDDEEDEKLIKTVSLIDSKIKNGRLITKTKEGTIDVPLEKIRSGLTTLRSNMLHYNDKIDEHMEEMEKQDPQSSQHIKTYHVVENAFNPNETIVKYKDQTISVPNEIFAQMKKKMENKSLYRNTPLRTIYAQVLDKVKRKRSSENNESMESTFFNPNKTMHSTPIAKKTAKKLFASKAMRQELVDDHFRKIKDSPRFNESNISNKSQIGSGKNKRRKKLLWESL